MPLTYWLTKEVFAMPVVGRIVRGLVGLGLVLALAACGPAPANESQPTANHQVAAAVAVSPTAEAANQVVWGRVPYCNCLVTTATANVANALKAANLTVSLKEQSPREGWLYFVVTFDPQVAPADQVRTAMTAGGAEVLQSPP